MDTIKQAWKSLRWTKFVAAVMTVLLSIAVMLTAGSSEKETAANNAVAVGMRTARTGACAANLKDGSVLITGGRGQNGVMAGSEVFHAKKGSNDAAAMAYGRADHACATLPDGSVLVAGGTPIGGGTINTAEVYNPSTGTWKTVGSMSAARAGAAAVQLPGGGVLLAGGESNGNATATLEVFEPSTGSFRPVPGSLSSPRMQHASIALPNGKVLIFGGTDGKVALDTIDMYDPAAGSVAPFGKKMSTPRQGLSATVLLDGRVFIAGGTDGKNETATTEIFDSTTNSFTPAASMTVPRKSHIAILIPHNNSVMITGGNARGGVVVSTELYIPWWNKYKLFGPGGAGSNKKVALKSAVTNTAAESAANTATVERMSANTMSVGPLTDGDEEAPVPTLYTDKQDYSPGETAYVSGEGWRPDTEITFLLARDPKTLEDTTWTAHVSADGTISTTYVVQQQDLDVTFTLTAWGGSGNTAQIQTHTFTDSQPQTLTVGAQIPNPIDPGQTATYAVNVTFGGNNSSCTVTLSAPLSPTTGTTASWGAGSTVVGSTVRVDITSTGQNVIRTLTIATTNTGIQAGRTSPGTYDVPVTATRGASCQGNGVLTASPVPKLVVAEACSVPSVTANPSNATIVYGNNATFTAAASGTPTPTVQWQVSSDNGTTWNNIAGATSTTLTVAQPGVALSGNRYRAVFANACNGSQIATSNAAILTITAKSLNGSFSVNNKVYDGNTSATIIARSIATGDVIGADDVSLTAGAATFANASAETAKTVTGTGFSLTGTAAANYILASTTLTTTADILAKQVTGSFTASNKVYDRTATATIATRTITSGIVGADDVSLAEGAATFADKNVGIGKTVTGTGFNLSGAAAPNYVLVASTLTTTADITTANVTGTFTVSDKVYDGTTAAGISSRSLNGVITGDTVSLTGGTATFGDKSVGTGKTVTAAGFILGGPDAGNYTLVGSEITATANITAKSITGSFTADDKTYDATTAATIDARSLTGLIAEDTTSLSGGTATFADKNVGAAKIVTGVGFSLSGPDAGNYQLASTTLSTTASITAATVTGSFTTADKVYDGTATATITGRSISGVIAGDVVTLEGGTGAFSDKSAGQNKTVTGTGFSLGGQDAANYQLGSVATTTASITPLGITGSFTASNKVYDGTTAATIASRNLNGVLGSDNVILSGGTASFADANVGTGKTVIGSGFTLSGTDAGNYGLTSVANTTADITPKQLTGSFTASNKNYDGNTSAIITERSVLGKVGGDDVSLSGGAATFDNKNVGTGKTVTGTGFGISGTAAGNYTLASTTLTTMASITAATVSGSFTAAGKVYDGTATATITGRSITGGVIAGDVVTLEGGTGAFSDKSAGQNKTVTGNGFNLGGQDAANYQLGSVATTTASITPLGITGSFTASNKVYDGTTAATIASRNLSGVLGSDNVILSGGTASFADANVGTGKTVTGAGFTLSGTDAGNYGLTSVANTTADITPKQLTGSFTASNKNYDGNTSATITERSVLGKVGGDDVSLSGGAATFDNKNVGTGKTVTGTGFGISGTAAGNYTLASTTLTTTASITAATVTGSFTAAGKVYDGTATATITGRSITGGVIAGDVVTLEGGTAAFSDKSAGQNKTVTGTGFNLGGQDAANYQLGSVATTTASITPLGITGSFTASNKVYDGTTAATIASRNLNGVLGSDNVSLSGGTASFADANVGTGKTVTGSGFTLSGTDAGNYGLTSVANTTADITPKQLTGSFTASNKNYDGNTSAIITERSVLGKVAGDDVSLSGGTATFDNKNVGTGKTVTGTGFGISGTAAGNYTLASTTLTTTASITAATVTGSFTAAGRVYDGTATATITGRSITGGVIAGDVVTLEGGTAAFSDKSAGQNKTVTGTGFNLGGQDAANYQLGIVATTTASITPLGITGSFTASNKVYDGTTAATIASRNLSGVLGSDNVILSGGTASFGDKNVGTGKPVTGTGFALSGTDASNYTLTPVGITIANITPATPTIIIVGGTFEYDGLSHPATASITGVAGDILAVTLSYSPASPIYPGVYTATAAYAGSLNYNPAVQIATVTIVNPAPANLAITGPTANANVFAVGVPVMFTATFTDTPGDSHKAEWLFDTLALTSPDPNVTITTGTNGVRTVTAKYTFGKAGVYKFKVRVTDCASCPTPGNTGNWVEMIDNMAAFVVIYDPNGGFVTGGGWIISPAGAYASDPTLTGKANFGFVSKYQKGAAKPSGETEFQFKAGNLNFNSTSYDWLVISGAMAQYKGAGTINGQPGYTFLLTGRDGRQSGGTGVDGFRIKITNTSTGAVVYDNKLGSTDDGTSANVQALGGGSIQIQQNK